MGAQSSLEVIAAGEMPYINGCHLDILSKNRHFPSRDIYDFLLNNGYIKKVEGIQSEKTPKYIITKEGEEFYDKVIQKPLEASMSKWRKIMKPRVDALRASMKLTTEDLRTYINI